ncbi:hypothetical protein FPQ18DRAFT_34861 [Pyronema domesticum]|uniref:Yeast cell wall synthesis Kre9/Knh1-like N-terminal domain-containing protein n=1 Tax=Pyronema omphalodes (strain CBS 100304) TaxID=1076935 RepID=U4LJB6_PYROM|nr:hypothetical protein FPQ18DRAFT_34861 [Pyronema domesticum]CCX32184.1 Similar to hypothetical protein [Tuber melanosporum Mel28]; acc. no. XP_002839042 [Pyronema omphalodes CBS 100304]
MPWARCILLCLVFAACLGAVIAQSSGQNPITSPLEGIYPSDKIIPVTWQPTTAGTITLTLLKGPQNNLVELGPLAGGIPNTGSYHWQIDLALEGKETMPDSHVYGIKIKDDLTGQFEYSPPFRLSIPDSTYGRPSVPPAATPTTTENTPDTTEAGRPSEPPAATPTTADNKGTDTTEATSSTETSAAESKSAEPSAFDRVVTGMGDDNNITVIAGAAGAGIGVIVIGVVIFIVWRRLKNEKRRLVLMPPGTSFRRRGTGLESEDSPTQERFNAFFGHVRFPSTSSFGDNGRASMLLEKHQEAGLGRSLSAANDSPPPTPFAAPTLTFPPVSSQKKNNAQNHQGPPHDLKIDVPPPAAATSPANYRDSRGFIASPHFRPELPRSPTTPPLPKTPPVKTPTTANSIQAPMSAVIAPSQAPNVPPAGFRLSAAPSRRTLAPKYTSYIDPNEPPSRPVSTATFGESHPQASPRVPTSPYNRPQYSPTNKNGFPQNTYGSPGNQSGLQSGMWDGPPLSPPPPAYSDVENERKLERLAAQRSSSIYDEPFEVLNVARQLQRNSSVSSSVYEVHMPQVAMGVARSGTVHKAKKIQLQRSSSVYEQALHGLGRNGTVIHLGRSGTVHKAKKIQLKRSSSVYEPQPDLERKSSTYKPPIHQPPIPAMPERSLSTYKPPIVVPERSNSTYKPPIPMPPPVARSNSTYKAPLPSIYEPGIQGVQRMPSLQRKPSMLQRKPSTYKPPLEPIYEPHIFRSNSTYKPPPPAVLKRSKTIRQSTCSSMYGPDDDEGGYNSELQDRMSIMSFIDYYEYYRPEPTALSPPPAALELPREQGYFDRLSYYGYYYT